MGASTKNYNEHAKLKFGNKFEIQSEKGYYMKKLVTTPITNTIWWATVNEEKGMITGKREDVTDNAIDAVF